METVQPLRSKRDINAMKNALHGRDKLMFVIGINSGLRISDILKLRVGDVRGKGHITLRETKTRKAKRFPINSAIKRAVADYVPAGTDDTAWLFPSRTGNKAITRVQAYRVLKAAADRTGINTEIGTHTLRKTFGYHAHKSGTDLATLQRIFNHAKQDETLRYIGLTQDTIDDVYHTVNL